MRIAQNYELRTKFEKIMKNNFEIEISKFLDDSNAQVESRNRALEAEKILRGASSRLLCESSPAETRLTVYRRIADTLGEVPRPTRLWAQPGASTFVELWGFANSKTHSSMHYISTSRKRTLRLPQTFNLVGSDRSERLCGKTGATVKLLSTALLEGIGGPKP